MLHGWKNISAREEQIVLEGIRDNAVYGGPFHVEFSPTDACNYKCFFCNSAYVDRSKRLPWERMEKLLDELHGMGMRSMRLAGGGEPLIYPEVEKVLDFCLERGVAISNVTTNGYKLTPGVVDRLLKLDSEEVIVSFNDITPEQYAKTNGTTARAFEIVLNNIRHLISERERRGLHHPRVVQQFFVWKGNHDQVETAYDIALSTGADKIYLRDMGGLDPAERMTQEELKKAGLAVRRIQERDRDAQKLILGFSYEKILEEVPVAEEKEANHKRNLEWHPLSFRRPPTRTEYCYIGWYSTVIRGNGDIFPCCMLSVDPEYKPMANLFEHGSFKEIWEGPAYQALRTELHEIAMGRGDYGAVTNPCLTRHYCAMRDACPFVKDLATPEFYAAVEEAIAPNRPSTNPLVRKMKALLG